MTNSATADRTEIVVRRVKVDRSRSAQEMLDATGCQQYCDPRIVNTMPRGESEEVEVIFFTPDLSKSGGHISVDDLEKEYERRGLKFCDPYSLIQANLDDETFGSDWSNRTFWKDENGNWCLAGFSRWHGEREVHVGRSAPEQVTRWFAGIRK